MSGAIGDNVYKSSGVVGTVAAGGGVWEYIARNTLSGDAANMEFINGTATTDGTPDFSSTYCTLMFHFDKFIPVTDAGQVRIQMSSDGGSSYLSTGYITGFNNVIATTSAASNSPLRGDGTYYRVTTSAWNDAGAGSNGVVYCQNPSETSTVNALWWQLVTLVDIGTLNSYYGGGVHTTAQDLDALSFYFQYSNVLSGSTIRMYGLKPS